MGQAHTAARRTVICSCGRILALASGLVLIFPCLAIGGLIGDGSWTRESEDGRYLLVMLYRSPQSDHDDAYTIELKRKYSQSGVYRRGQSKDTLLWSMPYQSRAYRTYFSPNGEHLLMTVPTDHRASDVPLGAALHFYHKDGTSNHWLEYQISRGHVVKEWLNQNLRGQSNEWTELSYDSIANTVTVKTNLPEEFVFDMVTGSKQYSESTWDWWSLVFLVIIPPLIYTACRISQVKVRSEPRRTRWQWSTAESLVFITGAALLLAIARVSIAASIVVLLLVVGGGAVAQFVARGRVSWWIGSLSAVYGAFVSLILYGMLCGLQFWRLRWSTFDLLVPLTVAVCLAGGVAGALLGGRIARKSIGSPPAHPDA
jgi:hypothetical protein